MSYNITEQEERIAREQTQKKLEAIVPRELLPNGSYAPVPGIFDIAWKGLLELPYFDFVRSTREFDNTVIKENEEWMLRLAPMVARKELDHEQLKLFEMHSFRWVDTYPVAIVENVFENLHNREVRDLIIRHAGEENGHSELEADFIIQAFGVNRLDVWDSKPLVKSTYLEEGKESDAMSSLRKESPELSYALVPFCERCVPPATRIIGKALREQYGFKDDILGFFDLHTYIDIYHERFGAYIMAKYARTRRLQELFLTALDERRKILIGTNKQAYYALKAK